MSASCASSLHLQWTPSCVDTEVLLGPLVRTLAAVETSALAPLTASREGLEAPAPGGSATGSARFALPPSHDTPALVRVSRLEPVRGSRTPETPATGFDELSSESEVERETGGTSAKRARAASSSTDSDSDVTDAEWASLFRRAPLSACVSDSESDFSDREADPDARAPKTRPARARPARGSDDLRAARLRRLSSALATAAPRASDPVGAAVPPVARGSRRSEWLSGVTAATVPHQRLAYEPNVRLPLGEHGRCELKGLIGESIKNDAELRTRVMAIAKLKCATISQLLHMAHVCGLWDAATAISERFVESRARLLDEDVTRPSTPATSSPLRSASASTLAHAGAAQKGAGSVCDSALVPSRRISSVSTHIGHQASPDLNPVDLEL